MQGLAWLIGAGAVGAGYILKVVLPYTKLGEKLPPTIEANGVLKEIRDELRSVNDQLREIASAVRLGGERLAALELEAPPRMIAEGFHQLDRIDEGVKEIPKRGE